MNTTHHHSVPSEPGFRDAGLGDLAQDLMRLSPAPNRSREVFTIVATVALLAAAIALLQPEPVVAAGLGVAAVLYHAVRWAIGTRTWGAR